VGKDSTGLTPSTAGMVVVCLQIAQIGLIGIPGCVFIGISYDLRTFGIARTFSDGIRAGNAVRLQLGGKLTPYAGRNVLMQLVHNPPAERMSVILACFLCTALTGCAFYFTNLNNSGRQK